MSIDVRNTCRMCMVSGSMMDLVSIFDDTIVMGSSHISISEKLKAINIMVPREHDPLPQLICCNCVTELDQAYQFKKKSLNSESVLLRIIGQHGPEKVFVKIESECTPGDTEATDCSNDPPLSECLINKKDEEIEIVVLEVESSHGKLEFPCLLCDRKYSTVNNLNQHIRRHLNGQLTSPKKELTNIGKTPAQAVPFNFHNFIGCPVCGMLFAKQQKYGEHNKTSHLIPDTIKSEEVSTTPINGLVGVVFVCHYDGQQFSNKTQIRQHMNLSHRPLSFTCDICSKTFKTPLTLKAHLDIVHVKSKKFICNECGKSFSTKRHMRNHSFHHLPYKQFKCDICDREFWTDGLLTAHQLNHKDERSYKCSFWGCDKAYERKGKLIEHASIHTGDRPYICPVCQKAFRQINCLKGHINANHKDHSSAEQYICHECGKTFPLKGRLKVHLDTHLPNKPFICPTCGWAFATKASLLIHLANHEGLKPYKCEYSGCTAAYVTKSKLSMHYTKHTGEKPLKCEFCPKKYRSSSCLSVHRRTHTNERPYKCQFLDCGKAFATKNYLQIHTRKHTGERPCVCSICHKGFSQTQWLKMHIKKKHPN